MKSTKKTKEIYVGMGMPMEGSFRDFSKDSPEFIKEHIRKGIEFAMKALKKKP